MAIIKITREEFERIYGAIPHAESRHVDVITYCPSDMTKSGVTRYVFMGKTEEDLAELQEIFSFKDVRNG